MKIKITHPLPDLQAGLIYDLPEKQAKEIIAKDLGFEIDVETIDVTAMADKNPVHIEAPKRKAKK